MTEPPATPPVLAMPDRPEKPLPVLTLLKTIPTNSLGVLDAELYRELFVRRSYGMVSACFVSDPAGVKRVLVDNFDNYPRVPTIRRLFEAEIGTGTLASEGETWRRHRRIATPSIDARSVKSDAPAIIALAEACAADLAKKAGAKGSKKPVDMERVAGDLLMRMLNQISTGGDPDAIPVMKWLSTVPRKPRALDIVPKPEWVSKLFVRRRIEGWKGEADVTLRRLIDARRSPDWAGGQDLLWRLAHARDRQDGQPFSAEEARDEAASIIAAGDATIRALTWIWYLLDLHPHVAERMHAEIDAVLGDDPLTPEHVGLVPYTRRVLDETMRLYPPIPVIVRKALKADEVAGQRAPKGAIMCVAPFIIHRHEKLWERPGVFDPDRFADENRDKRHRFAFIPFAAGPRVCPGASASSANLMFGILALARRLRFRLATKGPIVPFGGISLQPKGGLPMIVERRR
ncbi:cytochrome P450 [Chenggangzhangella methanolivorans]|uniref:Cytochrome P450 n=1 Tax=Chenggangzhangella methanolivorans TaxID=1437009 RepID=A0A9E6RCN0_9HYPH|nr:cytochrome P450 [Chenggangzhangella methanolivorans]QZO00793.1 cytochrome P450 [Chenggangzhangella methanolivorans]